jgi:hypothetical protein
LWAERFNGDTSDLFAVQDEITSRIALAQAGGICVSRVGVIQKNRCRTTVPDPIGEMLAELPFTGDRSFCLGHNRAVWSGPALYGRGK